MPYINVKIFLFFPVYTSKYEFVLRPLPWMFSYLVRLEPEIHLKAVYFLVLLFILIRIFSVLCFRATNFLCKYKCF